MVPDRCIRGTGRGRGVLGPAPGERCQAHTSQCTLAMNTETTEEMIHMAAHRLAFGVSVEEVAAGLRALGNSEEVVFLVVTAAKLLAR